MIPLVRLATRPILVEGCIDELLPPASCFRANWHLSASPAGSLMDYLERAHQIPGHILSAASCGDTSPTSSNDALRGRELKRRIDLMVEIRAMDNLEGIAR